MADRDAMGRPYASATIERVSGSDGPAAHVLLSSTNVADMVMSLVEWNGRLAETIVAQADQIVSLNLALTDARELAEARRL